MIGIIGKIKVVSTSFFFLFYVKKKNGENELPMKVSFLRVIYSLSVPNGKTIESSHLLPKSARRRPT